MQGITEHITHVRHYVDEYNGNGRYAETWQVPPDFSAEEKTLLKEFLVNGVLSPRESYECIRKLR